MKKPLSAFILIASIFAIVFSLLKLDHQKLEPEQTSGAYEALNFLSQQRTYPLAEIPENAHFAAWNDSKRLFDEEKRNPPTEPWTTMGPHNRGGRTLALEINPQNDQTLIRWLC